MTQDPRWADIFAQKQRLVLPGTAPRVLPLPSEGPTCLVHCSGRHEHDSWIACRKCGGKAARVILHEFKHQPGHYFNEVDGAAPRTCCNEPMIRVFR